MLLGTYCKGPGSWGYALCSNITASSSPESKQQSHPKLDTLGVIWGLVHSKIILSTPGLVYIYSCENLRMLCIQAKGAA